MTDDGAGKDSFDLSYDFQDDVAGFQIDILSDNTFILNDAYGGDLGNAGFLISTNESGYHSISWNGSNHASGVYIVQIQANGFNDTQKIMLLK